MRIKPRQISGFRKDVLHLLKVLKTGIRDEYRVSEGDTLPGIQITIGYEIHDGQLNWGYQTGDNSYAGGAYQFSSWVVFDLHRRSNCRVLANYVVDELKAINV